MNTIMLEHPATQRNLKQLKADGVHLIEPDAGEMACGTIGPGRLSEPERIVAAALEILVRSQKSDLRGERNSNNCRSDARGNRSSQIHFKPFIRQDGVRARRGCTATRCRRHSDRWLYNSSSTLRNPCGSSNDRGRDGPCSSY
jgi:hypothetical protein